MGHEHGGHGHHGGRRQQRGHRHREPSYAFSDSDGNLFDSEGDEIEDPEGSLGSPFDLGDDSSSSGAKSYATHDLWSIIMTGLCRVTDILVKELDMANMDSICGLDMDIVVEEGRIPSGQGIPLRTHRMNLMEFMGTAAGTGMDMDKNMATEVDMKADMNPILSTGTWHMKSKKESSRNRSAVTVKGGAVTVKGSVVPSTTMNTATEWERWIYFVTHYGM
ncbi:MAG: hypothetical protein Q9220_000111 [cf. Caloplaca sp. 1 TL-2023]